MSKKELTAQESTAAVVSLATMDLMVEICARIEMHRNLLEDVDFASLYRKLRRNLLVEGFIPYGKWPS